MPLKTILRKVASFSLLEMKRTIQRRRKEKNRDIYFKKIICQYFDENHVRKLQIGTGNNFLNGWLNTDLNYNEKVAYLDAAKIFPFESESFDYVYSEHLFEHLDFEQQLNMLKESLRVLKRGGKIRIVTPNFDFLINLYQEKTELNIEYVNWSYEMFLKHKAQKTNEYLSDSIYVLNNFMRDWGHKLIHNKSSIKNLLFSVGYDNIVDEEINYSHDKNLEGIEQHGISIPNKFNKLESMVIVAQKKSK